MIVDPETAPVVLQIYEWRAEKMGYGAITRRLNERDVPSPGRYRFEHGIITNNNKQGSALLWNRHVLTDILKNPVYIGRLQQGKRRASLYQGIPEHDAPADEWDVSCGTHDAIIPDALFWRVQEYNEQQRTIYRANYGRHSDLPRPENPYGAKLTCPDCGKQLKLNRYLANDGSRAYYAYVCPTFLEHREMGCSKKSIRSGELDQAVLETLKLHMSLFLDREKVLRSLMGRKALSPRQKQSERACDVLRKQIERKSGMSAALYSDWKEGILTREEYDYAKQTYSQEIRELKQRLEEELSDGKRTEETLSMAEMWGARIKNYQDTDSVTRDLVDAFIASISVDTKGAVKICFRFDDARELLSQEIRRLQEAA